MYLNHSEHFLWWTLIFSFFIRFYKDQMNKELVIISNLQNKCKSLRLYSRY